jgi:hypothetical protein
MKQTGGQAAATNHGAASSKRSSQRKQSLLGGSQSQARLQHDLRLCHATLAGKFVSLWHEPICVVDHGLCISLLSSDRQQQPRGVSARQVWVYINVVVAGQGVNASAVALLEVTGL